MHSEIQIISILFTCLYNNNTLVDSEIHKFINFEFRNYRLRLKWPLEGFCFRFEFLKIKFEHTGDGMNLTQPEIKTPCRMVVEF